MDRPALRNQWMSIFDEAIELDKRGKRPEASECYAKLGLIMRNKVTSGQGFSPHERSYISKIISCLNMRKSTLKGDPSIPEFTMEESTQLRTAFENLFDNSDFPMEHQIADRLSRLSGIAVSPLTAGRGTLALPKPFVRFNIDKIGVETPESYVGPSILVSVKNEMGNDIYPPKQTPISQRRHGNYIDFNGYPIEFPFNPPAISNQGVNSGTVYFELLYFKPGKKKQSVKCFAFLEPDEIKDGIFAMELYSKPIDPKKKNMKLLNPDSTLFLHAQITAKTSFRGTCMDAKQALSHAKEKSRTINRYATRLARQNLIKSS